MPDPDLQEIHDFLVDLAHQAGHMITTAVPTAAGSAGTKKNSADLVTETDRAVETFVSTSLREKFMGEETYRPEDRLTDAPTFIVDPIDGTTNFIHHYPYVCISLGLAIARKPCIGVVLNPYTSTLYTAIRGAGAYITSPFHDHVRLPLHPPQPFTSLSNCLVAVEWGSDRRGNDYAVKTATFAKLAAAPEEVAGGAMVHSLRSLGSAELNLCAVAAGQLDVYWEAGCYAWDVCAGWVVLEEAGGRMCGAHPEDWEPELEQRRYLAVRAGEGKEKVVREFWACVEGRVEVGYDNVS